MIRVFPSILGTAVQKRIEYQYDTKLERTKAELQASYSTLKTSVEFLSSTQSELRSKMIASAEKLWGVILAVEKEFSGIMVIDTLLLPNEADEAFRTDGGNSTIMQDVKHYRDFNFPMEKLERASALDTGTERLFVGERLWLICHTITRVHGRFGFLIHKSFEQRKYVNWRDDQFFISFLEPILSQEIIDNAKGKRSGGLNMIIAHLKAEFLKEATRVMSGSQGFADSLSDIHSTLQYESQNRRPMAGPDV